jgi:hypothetical protein
MVSVVMLWPQRLRDGTPPFIPQATIKRKPLTIKKGWPLDIAPLNAPKAAARPGPAARFVQCCRCLEPPQAASRFGSALQHWTNRLKLSSRFTPQLKGSIFVLESAVSGAFPSNR